MSVSKSLPTPSPAPQLRTLGELRKVICPACQHSFAAGDRGERLVECRRCEVQFATEAAPRKAGEHE